MKRDISLQFRRQVRISLVESKKVINLGILVANQLPSSLAHRIPYYVNASFEFTSAKFRLAPSISTIFSIPSARSRRSRAGLRRTEPADLSRRTGCGAGGGRPQQSRCSF